MAKVTVHPEPLKAGKRPRAVSPETITTEKGVTKRVMTVDANGASFGSDFLYVFQRNVRAARLANKEKTGPKGAGKARR